MKFNDYEEAVRMIAEGNLKLIKGAEEGDLKMDIYESMRLYLTNFLPCSRIVSSSCERTGRTAYDLGEELSEGVWNECFK